MTEIKKLEFPFCPNFFMFFRKVRKCPETP
jgi:hypothetical protein